MNIYATQFTLRTRSFEIYVAGCSGNPHCEGCQNPDTWDFEGGEKYNDSFLVKTVKLISDFSKIIDNIMIFGGEPLDQDRDELYYMLLALKEKTQKKIWLFTRYDLVDIPQKIKEVCDYIKTGRYIQEQKTDNNIQYNLKLATSNQYIYSKEKNWKK